MKIADMIPYDKCLHFIAGGFTAGIIYALTMNIWCAIAAAAAVGIAKEAYDYLHPDKDTAEVLDAVATIAGAAPILIAAYIHHFI